MNISDFIDYLDGDPEVNETIDDMLKRLRSQKVVKLEFYRKTVTQYKGWRPLPMAEYASRVRMSQKEFIEQELRRAREAANKRVIRQNNLKK